jgi:hypothetical protein
LFKREKPHKFKPIVEEEYAWLLDFQLSDIVNCLRGKNTTTLKGYRLSRIICENFRDFREMIVRYHL